MRRIGGSAVWRFVIAVLVLIACPPNRLTAQDTSRVVVTGPDTVHGVRPMGAFLRSLVIPGWGQAVTDRHVTGAVFIAWEGVTAMMTIKAHQEANYFKSIGSPNLRLKRQEVQDWLVLWVFNHLFSGAEAYVSAHLRDFPGDLQVRAFPGGIGVSIPLP
jgi:hypothetical protein